MIAGASVLYSGALVATFPTDAYDDVRGITASATSIILARARELVTIERASGTITIRAAEAVALDPERRLGAVRERGSWVAIKL